MEGHQVHGLAGGVIEMQPAGHQLGFAHQGEAFFVERQAVEAGAELGGEGFEPIQRPLLLKGEGVALDRIGGIEDAGATAGRFLGMARMGGRIGAKEEAGVATDGGSAQGEAMLFALGHR